MTSSSNDQVSMHREAVRLVHACLAQERTKGLVKKDYLRKVTETTDREFTAVEIGKRKLEDIFGLTLAPAENGSGYVVVSTLEMPREESGGSTVREEGEEFAENGDEIEDDGEFLDLTESTVAQAKRLILMTILACIYMDSEKVLSGGKIERLLTGLFGFSFSEKKHDVLGNVNELIMQEWPRQRYLKVTKSRDNAEDLMQSQFEWGDRAEYAVSKQDMLKFIARLHDTKPENFKDKLKEAEYQQLHYFKGFSTQRASAGSQNDNDEVIIVDDDVPPTNRAQKAGHSATQQPSSSASTAAAGGRRVSQRNVSASQMPRVNSDDPQQQTASDFVSRFNNILYDKRKRKI